MVVVSKVMPCKSLEGGVKVARSQRDRCRGHCDLPAGCSGVDLHALACKVRKELMERCPECWRLGGGSGISGAIDELRNLPREVRA